MPQNYLFLPSNYTKNTDKGTAKHHNSISLFTKA